MTSTLAIPVREIAGNPTFTCVACGRMEETPRSVLTAVPPDRPFDLVLCPGCSLVQQHPRYTPAQFRKLYAADYYVFGESDEHRWARAVQQYVVHLLPLENRPGRRLLDVGCALGHLAALARLRGWRVTGIDVSAEAVSQASVRFGLDVRAGSLARHRDTLGPVDTIFLGDCIEHVEDPAALMTDVRRALAPDGLVCIDTPNWASRWRRWGGGRWIGLNRYHVNLFDSDSLARLLEASGFADIRAAAYTNYRYEAWTARPEMPGWLNKLPRFIAWRVGRWLSRFNSNSPWARLRTSPPVNLNQARELVINYAHRTDEFLPASPAVGDNLIVHARRK
jgi:2-polyprenyl-3-methyl-5-hydroxy-6-metoxy-1,4-benzoquinol methylase